MSCLRIIIISLTLLTYFLVEPADLNYMETAIRDHFSNTRHHQAEYSSYKKSSKEYIYNEFVRFGLEAEYDTFNESIVSSTEQFHTVIGVLKGTTFGTANDSILGVGAHYDTVNTTKGVDDNGSGVAAMLEVIRQITDMNKEGTKRRNTIIFAAFDLEEGGLYGSKHFIQTWLLGWLSTQYLSNQPTAQGIIILETLMEYSTTTSSQLFPAEYKVIFPDTYSSIESDNFRGDFLTLIYRQPTDDMKLANAFTTSWNSISGRSQYEIEQIPLPFSNFSQLSPEQITAYSPFFRSDHVYFWANMVPAIQLTDTANYRGRMVDCYHKPCDNLTTMLTNDNINFLGKTADATAMTIHKLSEPTTATSGGLSLGISIPIPFIAAVVVWLRNQHAFA